MWMMVMFDLPVLKKKERKAATKFRKALLDDGFLMSQFSVYYKLLSGKEAVEKHLSLIENILPEKGKVDIISITDKQYENIYSFQGQQQIYDKNGTEQLLLF